MTDPPPSLGRPDSTAQRNIDRYSRKRRYTLVEAIGFVAAFLTTAAFVPQLTRVIRTRSARDISLPTFLLFSLGVALWLVYGLLTHSRPVVASNAVTLFLSVAILALKLHYDKGV